MMSKKVRIGDASIKAEEKNQALAAAVRAMVDTPYDVTENRRAEEIQRDAADIRNRERPEGRYSIKEAALLLLAKTGEYIRLGDAVWNGALISYAPGSNKKIITKGNNPKDWTSYDDTAEVYWDDLNGWLAKEYPRIDYKFQNPDTAPDIVKNEKPISVQKQQDNAILNWLKNNEYDPHKLPVPPPGKAGVKKLCSEAVSFSSPSVFKTAWDRLRSNGEIRDAK